MGSSTSYTCPSCGCRHQGTVAPPSTLSPFTPIAFCGGCKQLFNQMYAQRSATQSDSAVEWRGVND